jgi:hypothetical protein
MPVMAVPAAAVKKAHQLFLYLIACSWAALLVCAYYHASQYSSIINDIV